MEVTNSRCTNDVLGRADALPTGVTFICHAMRRLRLRAPAAKAAFIACDVLAQRLPVPAPHLALAPVDLWRLNQTLRPGRCEEDPARSLTPPERLRARMGRPRRSSTPWRQRRSEARRTLSACAIYPPGIRPDLALAEGPAVQP